METALKLTLGSSMLLIGIGYYSVSPWEGIAISIAGLVAIFIT